MNFRDRKENGSCRGRWAGVMLFYRGRISVLQGEQVWMEVMVVQVMVEIVHSITGLC